MISKTERIHNEIEFPLMSDLQVNGQAKRDNSHERNRAIKKICRH